MRLICNAHHFDPAVNLALEEHCFLRTTGGETGVLLYVNGASVIIGRNQNPLQEADWAHLEKRRVPLLRRMSGGGAVYHDPGNLNFSFIGPMVRDRERHFRRLTSPIRDALRGMGVPVDWNARNDLVVHGRKVSGNAHYIARGSMMSHGTLLFDADLKALTGVLRATLRPAASKATASVRSPVANIKDFLEIPMTMAAFRDRILVALAPSESGFGPPGLGKAEWDAIHGLAKRKYRGWDWTMGRTPAFSHAFEAPLNGVGCAWELRVERAVVVDVSVKRGGAPAEALGRALSGCRFDLEALEDRLTGVAGSSAEARHLARRVFGLV